MNERPILFNGDMVRAILDGRKTQTRRVVKNLPQLGDAGMPEKYINQAGNEVWGSRAGDFVEMANARCPYGQPGDRLWVRETIERIAGGERSMYAADGTFTVADAWPWKRNTLASIHCPRGLSRILLEIVSVRVERLQEISDEDIEAEGITADCVRGILIPLAEKVKVEPCHWFPSEYTDAGANYCPKCAKKHRAKLHRDNPDAAQEDIQIDGGWETDHDGPPICSVCVAQLSGYLTNHGVAEEIEHFMSGWDGRISPPIAYELLNIVDEVPPALLWRIVWNMINGPGSWDVNPWVWVIEFERLKAGVYQ